MINNGKRLLLKQSKGISLTVVKKLIESDDVEIRQIDNHDEVISIAFEWKPDVIVISESDNPTEVLSLCGKIRSHPYISGIPLLILGEEVDRGFRTAALENGADECLSMRGDTVEISLKLGNMLKLRRHRRTLAEHDLFAMTCEQVAHGILLIDKSYRVIQSNQVAQTEYGIFVEGNSTWFEQLSERFTIHPEQDLTKIADTSIPGVFTMLEGRGAVEAGNEGRRWFKCAVYPLVDDPERRALVTMTDVTKQLEMEDILLGVKRLISHKMLTPLNGIIGPLEIVLEDEADGKDRVKLLKTAMESAEDLAGVVSRLEEFFLSPFSHEDSEFTRAGELKNIITQAASDLLIAGIDFNIKTPAKTIISLGGQKMLAVFTELLENAVKFHPRHRPEIQIIADVKNDKLRVDVIDDGCHIPLEAMKYIHLPFFQPGVGIAGEIPGHGIGLAQVSRIVMAAGGSVRFANRTSCDGVCVSVFLPVSSPKDSKKMSNADIFAGS